VVGKPQRPQPLRSLQASDLAVLGAVVALLYLGVRLALHGARVVPGPDISLDPAALPYYAVRSTARMAAAYALSLGFTLVCGYLAAYDRRAEQVLVPVLDVLQSVPILSFLPVTVLALSAVLPEGVAAEAASVVLIFTSQVWNLTFSWYQSLKTVPAELREASQVFRFNGWVRLKALELPFATPALIWNSMMSWAGGWFFLMAAETFQVGERDFRLPGLGSYLQEAAQRGDVRAILWGVGALVAVIVILDQLAWRPLIAWSHRFTLEMTEREEPPTSWFYDVLRSSSLARRAARVAAALGDRVDAWMVQRFPFPSGTPRPDRGLGLPVLLAAAAVLALVAYGALRGAVLLSQIPLRQWTEIGLGLLVTALRVLAALAVTLLWTVPVGVAVGTNPRLARWVQPLVQIAASVPATALFPVFVLLLATLPGGLNLAALLLMLAGTQWYVLFNVIAGASAIPQELRDTSRLLRLHRGQQWRILLLPALFPYLVTGALTAAGGAWNASVVAEYVTFGGTTLRTTGLGALISLATHQGDFPLLFAATVTMVLAVVLVNRLFWRRLYRLAQERYRME
jgi:NitT/TauT family transport system permease protein